MNMSENFFQSFKENEESSHQTNAVDSRTSVGEKATSPFLTEKPSSSTGHPKDSNDEAVSLIQKLQKREEKNKETIKNLRQLTENVVKKKIIVEAVLKEVKRNKKTLKKENRAAESDVSNAVENLQKLLAEKEGGTEETSGKTINAKDRLRKGQLVQALNDLLKELENAANNDQKDIEAKIKECKEMEDQIEKQAENENDKIEQRFEAKECMARYRAQLKALEKDVEQWKFKFYQTIKKNPENFSDSLLKSFEKVMKIILELADRCDETKKDISNLTNKVENLQKFVEESDRQYDENLMVMDQLEKMPKKYSQKILQAVEDRENVTLPPQMF